MRQVAYVCLLLALIAGATAVPEAPTRKMLTLNGQQNTQQWGNDRGFGQLAANNRAIVNTQRAINAAVESGANPRVTEAAANYGNYQAYRATQYTPCSQWRQGMNWSGTNCGKK